VGPTHSRTPDVDPAQLMSIEEEGQTCVLPDQNLIGNAALTTASLSTGMEQPDDSSILQLLGATSDTTGAISALGDAAEPLFESFPTLVDDVGVDGVSGGFSVAGGAIDLVTGASDLFAEDSTDLERVAGGGDALAGLTSIAGAATNNPIAQTVLAPVNGLASIVTGGAHVGSGAQAIAEDGYNDDGYFDVIDGTSDIISGMLFASPQVQAVTGSLQAGIGIGRYGDGQVRERGWAGQDSWTGENRSASDMAGDWGLGAREWAYGASGSDGLGHVAGGLATLGGSIVGAGMSLFGALAGAVTGPHGPVAPAPPAAIDNGMGHTIRRGDDPRYQDPNLMETMGGIEFTSGNQALYH
jgi:hypothetical protein